MENQTPIVPVSPSEEHAIRLEKVRKLREMGIDPWPANYEPVDSTAKDIIQSFVPDAPAKSHAIAGRLVSSRGHGKTAFGHILDHTGRLQIYLRKDVLGDERFNFFTDYLDLGDIVWLKGSSFKTKTGEITLEVHDFKLLSKCLFPLPEKFHGIADVEMRYRQRYLDLISSGESRERFRKRATVIQTIRSFLDERDFLEVETPILHPIPGGAAARPFITHHNALHMDLYLRVAAELYIKKLILGSFERVYEIGRVFRNEGISTRHNPEFTMIDINIAYIDYKQSMEMIEQLIQKVAFNTNGGLQIPFGTHMIDFEKPFLRISPKDALIKFGGVTEADLTEKNIDKLISKYEVKVKPDASLAVKIFGLFEELAEPHLIQPTYIVGFPVELSPLSKRDPKDTNVAARYELYIAGMEIANGFNELNDPFDQAERFKEQARAHAGGDIEAMHYDADYVHALEYALPPNVGCGIGIDRLTMLMTNTTSIKDVILFPTLKLKQEEHHAKVEKEPVVHIEEEEFVSTFALPKLAGTSGNSVVINPAIFERYPQFRLGILVVRNMNNEKDVAGVKEVLQAAEASVLQRFANQSITEIPVVAAWRNAYKMFGVKPSDYQSGIERLLRRVSKGSKLPAVNSVVDLCNAITLSYLLPSGTEDLDATKGNIQLTFATDNEVPVIMLGDTQAHPPLPGEVIYKDDVGTICRAWNWKEVDRTKVTKQTKDAVIVLEALRPEEYANLERALTELAENVTKYTGGTVTGVVLDAKLTRAAF